MYQVLSQDFPARDRGVSRVDSGRARFDTRVLAPN